MFWCMPVCSVVSVCECVCHCMFFRGMYINKKNTNWKEDGCQPYHNNAEHCWICKCSTQCLSPPLCKSLTLGIKRLIWKVTYSKRGALSVCVNKSKVLCFPCVKALVFLFFSDLFLSAPLYFLPFQFTFLTWNSRSFCLFFRPQMFQQPYVALSDSLVILSPCGEWEPTTQPST